MSPAARIRFLGDLDELLARDRRGQEVRYRFDVGPSVKDAVEALGVPHTEVGGVEANGAPVGLSHRLAGGDRITVHPRVPGCSAGAPGTPPVSPGPGPPPRFVADVHLGRLARYLRLLGFDTRFQPDWTDAHLAAIAAGERRTLLSRDRGLLKRRAVTSGVLVRPDDPEAQAVDVVRRLGLAADLRPLTRCMACNGTIDAVDRDEVAGRLPPWIREHFERFRRCRDCDRVYWEGSHHRRLLDLVERVRRQAAAG